MKAVFYGHKAGVLAGLALAVATTLGAQSTSQPNTPGTQSSPPSAQPSAPSDQPSPANPASANTPAAQQAPGTTPVPGNTSDKSAQQAPAAGTAPASTPDAQPAPGTTPVAGDTAPPPPKSKKDAKKSSKNDSDAGTTPVKGDDSAKGVDPDKVIDVGGQLTNVKKGSIEDVSAVGNREIGGRGMGNWYSTDSEIKMGKQYADQIEKSTRFITDPVVTEYVNRIGQNIVKNSDCKVPFTIKVIDSDEINAMALPGGFFYVNSGLILNADEEAELAGVMAHETAHVCAHHAAREMTRMNYAQLGTIPLIMMTGYSWTGYGIYEAVQLAVPMTFLMFSREFEAQADYLGVQYMYRAGYDPQAFISFFEKVQALEKRKPGLVSKAFSDHPQTPDRILHSQEEIARILPSKDEYTVTTSEFEDVKARLARIENKRRLLDNKDGKKPSLRRANTGQDDSSNSNGQAGDSNSNGNDRPTLHRREDQN
jgi:Peptidase family M48